MNSRYIFLIFSILFSFNLKSQFSVSLGIEKSFSIWNKTQYYSEKKIDSLKFLVQGIKINPIYKPSYSIEINYLFKNKFNIGLSYSLLSSKYNLYYGKFLSELEKHNQSSSLFYFNSGLSKQLMNNLSIKIAIGLGIMTNPTEEKYNFYFERNNFDTTIIKSIFYGRIGQMIKSTIGINYSIPRFPVTLGFSIGTSIGKWKPKYFDRKEYIENGIDILPSFRNNQIHFILKDKCFPGDTNSDHGCLTTYNVNYINYYVEFKLYFYFNQK